MEFSLGGGVLAVEDKQKNVIYLDQFDAALFFELLKRQRKKREKELINNIEKQL